MTVSTEEILRMIIREEIGRNYHTLDNSPYDFSEFPGYDVEIILTAQDRHLVDIRYQDANLTHPREFNSRAEAELYARNIVERHRLQQA
tara:strand:+ start:145 stop:411 length:267 start_codon:yes stop_codon:yes gene_type:complete